MDADHRPPNSESEQERHDQHAGTYNARNSRPSVALDRVMVVANSVSLLGV
jgi:hypothetical protein